MRIAITIIAFVLPCVACAENLGSKPPDADRATERGLAFLAADAAKWNREHGCASCHHAGLVVWALHEAKQRGRSIDEPLLAELSKAIAEDGDGKTGIARPKDIPKAINSKALYFALALAADPSPDEPTRKGLNRYLQTVREDQNDNGSWSAWPKSRPPIFGPSDDTVTSLATLALLSAPSADKPALKDDAKAVQSARDAGARWLAETKSDDDPQSVALRLVVWSRLQRPTEKTAPLVERIKARQNDDGGWSQSDDMSSDAWATGQALYALAHARLGADDPAIARGRAFLVGTQRNDGSWPMTSRPTKTSKTGARTLIPITGGGSAWAVLGLVRSG